MRFYQAVLALLLASLEIYALPVQLSSAVSTRPPLLHPTTSSTLEVSSTWDLPSSSWTRRISSAASVSVQTPIVASTSSLTQAVSSASLTQVVSSVQVVSSTPMHSTPLGVFSSDGVTFKVSTTRQRHTTTATVKPTSTKSSFQTASRHPTNTKTRGGKTPPHTTSTSKSSAPLPSKTPSACFPALGQMLPIPSTPATKANLANWWCDQKKEYAFMGFSYDLSGCPSLDQLRNDFTNMKKTYNARYVRLYGACDPTYDTMNNVVEAATSASIGVYSLVWFGFDGDDKWQTRLGDIKRVINTNSKAPYVIRNIAIGSEPLFDHVLSEQDLANVIRQTRQDLSKYGIQVTLSDMPYGFQSNGNAPDVFSAVDILEVNALPFFDGDATTGWNAWGSVSWMISYIQQYGGKTKPLRLTQTGWPSNQDVWKANSPNAVSDIANEKGYFDMLDSHCKDFKPMSLGWFAQIYEDNTLPGWGIVQNGQPKFAFKPKTTC